MRQFVYAPSSLTTWSQCPKRWVLSRQGWRPAIAEKVDVAKTLGKAFASAVEYMNRELQQNHVPSLDLAVQRAQEVIEADIQFLTHNGVDIHAYGVLPDLRKTIELAMKTNTYEPGSTLLYVEQSMPDDRGRARADAVYESGGIRVVREYKLKLNFQQRYMQTLLNSLAYSDQTFHYLWMYEAHTMEYFVYTDKKLETTIITPLEEQRQAWLRSALEKSRVMEDMREGRVTPWLASEHETKYGVCPYRSWCMDAYANPELASMFGLIQIQQE